MRKKKAIQEQELKEHEQKLSLSLVTRSLSEFGTWRGFDSFELCLVLNEMSKKLGCLEWWWLGVFIALNHHIAVGEAVCRWAHRTVRCGTGKVLFTVRCASDSCSDFCTHCSRTIHAFADDRCAG
jgi:hypothetical protein